MCAAANSEVSSPPKKNARKSPLAPTEEIVPPPLPLLTIQSTSPTQPMMPIAQPSCSLLMLRMSPLMQETGTQTDPATSPPPPSRAERLTARTAREETMNVAAPPPGRRSPQPGSGAWGMQANLVAPIGWQMADYLLPAKLWLDGLRVKTAAHIQMPRKKKSGAPGSQHVHFTLPNSPPNLVRWKCLEAGLVQKSMLLTPSSNKRTITYQGLGPMTAYRFCDVKGVKAMSVGSGVLVKPGKNCQYSDQLVLALPPICVTSVETPHGWHAIVDFYIGVWNSADRFTLPSPANLIYKDQLDPTEIFKKMARTILGELCMDQEVAVIIPNFRKLLAPEYHSDAGELTESEEEEEESLGESEEENG